MPQLLFSALALEGPGPHWVKAGAWGRSPQIAGGSGGQHVPQGGGSGGGDSPPRLQLLLLFSATSI